MTTNGYTYEYDTCGVLCRYSDRLEGWEVLEPHCLNCGYGLDDHDDADCEWEDAPYIQDDTPAAERVWHKLRSFFEIIEEDFEVKIDGTDVWVKYDRELHKDCTGERRKKKSLTDLLQDKDPHIDKLNEETCEWCRAVMNDELPPQQKWDDFLATPHDCPKCEYERQECLKDQRDDELNDAIDASGNCF